MNAYPAPGNRSRVLVADDEPTQLFLTQQALESEGYLVETAENGQQALDLFSQTHPDIILLDVIMPAMDGFATCEAIRHLPASRHIPILMVTGLEDLTSINKAYDSGATDFITKPLNWRILAQRVRYMLRASQAMMQLQQSEELLANAQRIARLGNWEWDPRNRQMQWSAEIFRLFQVTPEDTRPSMHNLISLIAPEDRQCFQEALEETARLRKKNTLEVRTAAGRHTRHLDARIDIKSCRPEAPESLRLVGTFQDITRHKRAMEKIRFLASYDTLTGLPNRDLFKEQLHKAISEARRSHGMVGIMVLNIDRFKRINDSLGNAAGDQLIREVGERLKKSVRQEDSLGRNLHKEKINISRRGGDEFSLLFSGITRPYDLTRLAHRMQKTLRQPYVIDDQEVFITASIGIAIFPADGDDAAQLLKNGDTALHYAKEQGWGSCQFYSDSINDFAIEQMQMESGLMQALDKDQFTLYYQPQVNISLQRITGVEALIRWKHPELGLVPPLKFIPLAEDSGLINEIGTWLIHTACAQQVAWVRSGYPPLRVGINVSAVQFRSDSLIDTVAQALEKTGLDPGFLELELTESIILNESAELIDIMQRLKQLGVRIVVDDFGTGYSSLRYLKHFPLDALKIDRSFIRDIPEDPNDTALALAIMSIARSLSMGVIAEGVETRAQFDFLARHFCQEIQGYLFSPPVPASTLTTLLADDLYGKIIKGPDLLTPQKETNL